MVVYICLSICGSTRMSIYGSIRMSICGSIRMSICGSMRMSICGSIRTKATIVESVVHKTLRVLRFRVTNMIHRQGMKM